MGKTYNEQKVLKKLVIDDFRHMTKDKVMVMASMLDKMDPEVAKKALEQFPDFSNTMREVLTDYKSILEKAMAENGESVSSYYETCDAIIATCQKELEKDNLSFEERKQIIGYMMEVANMKNEKDIENKKFIAQMCMLGVSAIGITVAALLTALGGNTKVDINNS